MTEKDYKRAQQIKEDLSILKDHEIHCFNPERKWVYLQISDHYGNKGPTIKTYAFTHNAFGSKLESFIADKYGEFLQQVSTKILARIKELKEEFNNLGENDGK